MSHDPTGKERLILWWLAASGGECSLKDVQPKLDAPDRRKLEAADLIESEKRKPAAGGRAVLHVVLTDRGWAWLAEHLEGAISTRSTAGALVLERFLGRLSSFLDARQLTLAEFIRPGPGRAETLDDVAPPIAGLDRRIEATYFDISGGRPNVRVRLADLRRALAEVPRDRLDAALLKLAIGGKASLYRLDNPTEIGPEDREAVLRTATGEERHIIYLGGRGS